MLPVIIDPKYIKAIVIGKGPATDRRLEMLEKAGVRNVEYYKTCPEKIGFKGKNIAYVADFDEEESKRIFDICNKFNILTNVEDKKDLCNFHAPAIVRRGDLLLTVSTNSKSPRLSRQIRKVLEGLFDESWAEKLVNINKDRQIHRDNGLKFEQVAAKTDEFIEKNGFFSNLCQKCKDFTKKSD